MRAAATILVLLLVGVAGCSAHRPLVDNGAPPRWSEDAFARKEVPSFAIDTDAKGAPAETVVGRTSTYRARDGDAFVEAHPDIYRYTRSLAADARTALRKRGLSGGVDASRLEAALLEQSGVPVPLAAESERTAALAPGPR